ncbi:MAG: efflux transporter outer membrane subunit [Sphingobium sp.]|nr:efflux transporter outer membrane subunit [Sphingobium sp.]
MRASLSALTLAMSLSACAGPAVETARVDPVSPPDRWQTELSSGAPLDREWWQAFHDPALSALVERALANNLDVAIAGARIRDARAQEMGARAALLPTLDAGAGAARSRGVSPFGTPSVQTAAQPLLQAAWDADLFGRLSDQRSAARSAWLASEAARDAIRLSIASTVASGYVTLLALDARLAVARQTVEARQQALALIKRRTDAGYSPKLELAQAQAEYEAARQIIAPLEQARSRQENGLRLLCGDLPGPVARGAALDALAEPGVPGDLPSELLRRRPDVAQAELALAASDHALAAARKRFLPQLRLTGSAGAAFSTLLQDPITLWSIGGSVLAPLFEGGRLRAGAESAAAQRDVATFAYRKAALNAFREVDDALTGVVRADEQVRLLTAQRVALAETFRLASNRYRAGYSPYLEQLDAQRGLLAAELGLVQARADAFTARISLYQALGGGWSPMLPSHE